MTVPAIRIRTLNDAPVAAGDYVLYWMIAARRTSWNFALDRAVHWAQELKQPLVVFEALRCDYPWASDRLHRFVIEGMIDTARRLQNAGVAYYPYVEPRPDVGKGLLTALSARASVVISDEFPAFFLAPMVQAVGRRLGVRSEVIDSNGMLPLRAADQVFSTAYQFRRFLQKNLPEHLDTLPSPDPFRRAKLPSGVDLPKEILKRWPAAALEKGLHEPTSLAALPIDHRVAPASFAGGAVAAATTVKRFLREGLDGYLENRNELEHDASTGLSPYLHFGHISTHEIFHRLTRQEGWSRTRLGEKNLGKRSGWWGVGASAEALLDQLITWRELGYNMCAHRADYDRYESLPDWAQTTLARHAADPRPMVYSLEQFEQSQTHDPLWNAAQTQLVREGRMHNYLRMLWGKKILEWSASPQGAIETMIELNNKYAVDGRDPNSYSGIFWVLGRYDRPWGPERPIFGKVRYMSSENTARKFAVDGYIQKYSA